MPDFFQPFGKTELILIVFFSITLLLQLIYLWFIFFRLAIYRDKKMAGMKKRVSVVICSRDGYSFLKENLPYVLDQDYSEYEVVVVNNNSDDDSSYLLSQMAEEDKKLQIVEIRQNRNFFSGKKFPLSIGIKSAHNDLILLTDADCKPVTPRWLGLMQGAFTEQTEIVLGYGGYKKYQGLLNRLIRFDSVQIAIQYLSYALAGIPYMGVGRNMAYKKSLFYESKGFISHYNISSGDDDLFVNRVARKRNTRIMIDPDSFTLSEPKRTFRDWIIQKRRHLSTGNFYRLHHKILLGAYQASTTLFLVLLIALLVINNNIFVVLALFIVRLFSQLFIYRRCSSRLNEKGIWMLTPILEVLMLMINGFLSFTALFTKPVKWK